MVDLVVWVLEAEMAVLTEEEAVVFRGSWGLSCHGGAGRTFREVGALLRRILSGLRVDQGRRRKGSKSNPTPTLPQTNRSINLLGGSKEERCWFKKRRKEEAKERKAGRKEKEEKEEEQLVEEGIG